MGSASCGKLAVMAGLAASALVLASCGGGGGSGGGSQATGGVAPAGLAAPSRPEKLVYAPPAAEPGGVPDERVAFPPAATFDLIQDLLRQAGLSVSLADERAGIITATYDGDPEPFLDCGTIRAESELGTTRRLGAAAETLDFRRKGFRGQTILVRRELELQVRLVIQLRPDGDDTRVRSKATYVVGKRTISGDGQPRLETIAFESGGRGRFARGTVCQPNGALERLPLAAGGA